MCVRVRVCVCVSVCVREREMQGFPSFRFTLKKVKIYKFFENIGYVILSRATKTVV